MKNKKRQAAAQRKSPVYGLVLLFLAAAVSSAYTGDAGNGTGVTEAELQAFNVLEYTEAERFPLENLVAPDGSPFDPLSTEGKYVLVNLWATWCRYCVREKPSMQGLYEKYGNETFTVLAISLGEDPKTVGEYMESSGYTMPVIIDRENRLKAAYAPRIPRTYILDPQGNITASISGSREWTGEEADRILRHLIPVLEQRGRR
jgi:thiol-disulfide isomerase/thioredoxin